MRSRGITLLEFAVVVACAGIVAGVLLERVPPLIRLAERTAFAQVRSQLGSALLLEAAERIARGEPATLASFQDGNPVDLLLQPPHTYRGSFEYPDYGTLPRRSWVFDETAGVLVYLPRSPVRVAGRDADRIELYVRFAYHDRDGDGAFDPERDRFEGIGLAPVLPWEWLED